jgi:hypothetical protein
MNELIKYAVDSSKRRGLTLILTQDKARESKINLIASLILKGPLFVLSGDEWLPSFVLPRMLRGRTTDIKAITGRLRTVRASTCYRLFDSLATTESKGEPILVMDFLHTFYDDDIPLRTRLFKLRECCRELMRLAFYRPVIVMTQEREGEAYEKFVPALSPLADKTLTLEQEIDPIRQTPLF